MITVCFIHYSLHVAGQTTAHAKFHSSDFFNYWSSGPVWHSSSSKNFWTWSSLAQFFLFGVLGTSKSVCLVYRLNTCLNCFIQTPTPAWISKLELCKASPLCHLLKLDGTYLDSFLALLRCLHESAEVNFFCFWFSLGWQLEVLVFFLIHFWWKQVAMMCWCQRWVWHIPFQLIASSVKLS